MVLVEERVTLAVASSKVAGGERWRALGPVGAPGLAAFPVSQEAMVLPLKRAWFPLVRLAEHEVPRSGCEQLGAILCVAALVVFGKM